MKFKAGTTLFAFLLFAFCGTVFAATVEIKNGETVLATVSSDSQILGYRDGSGFNEKVASVFNTGNSGQDTETNFLSNLLGDSPTVTFSTKVENFSGDSNSFNINNRFFAVKFGNFENGKGGTAFFEVLGPSSSIKVTFTKQDGSGLSHVTQFAAVPIPAAAWLFGSALLGLIGVGAGRRRSA